MFPPFNNYLASLPNMNQVGNFFTNLIPRFDLEQLVLILVFLLLTPYILGVIISIFGFVLKTILFAFLIVTGMALIFKTLFPCAACSIPDMFFTIMLSAGFPIPDFVLAAVSQFMGTMDRRSNGQAVEQARGARPKSE